MSSGAHTPTERVTSALRRGIIVIAITVAVGVALLLVSRLGGRHVTWTAAPSPGALPLPVPIAFADSATKFAAVDSYVVREMRGVRAPGLAVVIVHGDRIVHARGFGVADSRGRPVTTSTPFILGSLTKSFTAVAVVQLSEAGKIGLDSPVQRYLPWFRVRDPAASARITVRHLLNHTSGLPKAAGLQLVRGAQADTRVKQARLLRRVKLRHPPGAAFEYSNANYWLLGLVLEAATGDSYEDYVHRRILEPLGMRLTFTSESTAQAYGLAQGYRVWFGFPRPEELPYYARELAVGYLISTAGDMGLYLSAQLGAQAGGPAVISPSALAELHTPPRGSPYAMGWLADSIAGVPVLWHTGAVANYHGDMLLIPARAGTPGIGVVMLANVNNFLLETQLGQTIKGVGALMLGFQPPAPEFLRFREIYWLIAGIACVWLAWRIDQIATLSRWSTRRSSLEGAKQDQRRRGSILVDPGVSLTLLVGVSVALGSPLSTLRWFVPDLTDWLVLNAVLSVVIGACRLLVARSTAGRAAQHGAESFDSSRQSR